MKRTRSQLWWKNPIPWIGMGFVCTGLMILLARPREVDESPPHACGGAIHLPPFSVAEKVEMGVLP